MLVYQRVNPWVPGYTSCYTIHTVGYIFVPNDAVHIRGLSARFNHLCKMLGRPWHLTFRPHAGEAASS